MVGDSSAITINPAWRQLATFIVSKQSVHPQPSLELTINDHLLEKGITGVAIGWYVSATPFA